MGKKSGLDLKIILLIALLCLSFIKTYSIHQNFSFPYHHDEWQHLAFSMQIIDAKHSLDYNPYLSEANYYKDMESGFHIFLSTLILMTNLDPFLHYQYLAAFFSVLSSFFIFLCMYRFTRNYLIGTASVIIFIFIPGNVNILGKEYFVPLSLAISFIFAFILYFHESLEKQSVRELFLSLLIFVSLFFIHPPSAVILLFPSLIDLFFNSKLIGSFMKKATYLQKAVIIGFLILSSVMIFFSLWRGDLNETWDYLSRLIYFKMGWGKLEIIYSIPLLYGILNSILAVAGFAAIYFKKEYKPAMIILFFAFLSLGLTSIFSYFGFTLIVPYQRAIHYSMLGMIGLTAIGLAESISKIQYFFQNYGGWLITSIVIILFFLVNASNSYPLNIKYERYSSTVIDENDYAALLWAKDNLGRDNVFVTPYFMTSAVYPISKNRVISLIPAQMGGGLIDENLNFFSYDCSQKKDIIDRSHATFVLSKVRLECNYLLEIYNLGDYIYKVA